MQVKMRNVVRILKFGAVIAVAAAVVLVLCGVKNTAYAEVTSGVEGGVAWSYSADGKTLTISPASSVTNPSVTNPSVTIKGYTYGEMIPNYSKSAVEGGEGAPAWGGTLYQNVENIVIEDGVTNITKNAFNGTYDNRKTNLKSVTIGKDVEKIAGESFTFVNIPQLVINSTAIDEDDDISATAFLSVNTEYRPFLDVQKVYSANKIVQSYFERFQEGSSTSVTLGGVSYGTVIASDVEVNPFYIIFVDRNALDDGATVQYKREGKDWKDVVYSQDTVVVASLWDVYDAFKAKGYAVDSRVKLFDISRNDDISSETVQIKMPVPSEWKEHADTIKVLTYANDGTVSITEVEGVTIEDGYITFTPPHYSPYALYYSYEESSSNPPAVTDPSTGDTVKVEIDASYFKYFAYKVGTNSADVESVGTTDYSLAAAVNALSTFKAANELNNSGYKTDDTYLKAFDVTAYVNGVAQSDKIESLRVWIPIPSEWAAYADQVKILTITDGKIVEVEKLDRRTNNGTVEIEFVPPHFSPYALYFAGATSTTTVTTPSTPQATTPAASTPTAATKDPSNTSTSTSGSGSGLSGLLDRTPITGVKGLMWIAVPIAIMLMGVGLVVLGMRKRKNLDE